LTYCFVSTEKDAQLLLPPLLHPPPPPPPPPSSFPPPQPPLRHVACRFAFRSLFNVMILVPCCVAVDDVQPAFDSHHDFFFFFNWRIARRYSQAV
jgi:hypothetical protein